MIRKIGFGAYQADFIFGNVLFEDSLFEAEMSWATEEISLYN